MSRFRRPPKKKVGPPERLWADGEPSVRPGESQILETRLDMVTAAGTMPGLLVLTDERIFFRVLDVPPESGRALIVEALGNIRLGYPTSGPENEFILVLSRGGVEIPLHVRRPASSAADDSVQRMFNHLQRRVGRSDRPA